MFSRDFWLGDNGALTRSIRTFAQTAAAMLTVATFTPFSINAWADVLVVAATAALVSLLMSVDRREALLTAPPGMVAQPAAVAAPPPVSVVSVAGSDDPASADYRPTS